MPKLHRGVKRRWRDINYSEQNKKVRIKCRTNGLACGRRICLEKQIKLHRAKLLFTMLQNLNLNHQFGGVKISSGTVKFPLNALFPLAFVVGRYYLQL